MDERRDRMPPEEGEKTARIRVYPDPVLIRKAMPVRNIDGKTKAVVDRMSELMYANKGIGLAAPQVGISSRILIVDVGQGLRAFINPEILEAEGEVVLEEGCLSLPGIEVPVKRKQKVLVRGRDMDGKEVNEEVFDFQARVYQHEIDHLNGTLIVHYLSSLKRGLLIKKMRKELERSP